MKSETHKELKENKKVSEENCAPIIINFIDFEKAFDSLDKNASRR